uniref:Uncharacterized protein n=1 Tax=Sphaerodactylus townsendi TaxID=933632 RepID=A0ACB8F8F8_9SAUR
MLYKKLCFAAMLLCFCFKKATRAYVPAELFQGCFWMKMAVLCRLDYKMVSSYDHVAVLCLGQGSTDTPSCSDTITLALEKQMYADLQKASMSIKTNTDSKLAVMLKLCTVVLSI